MSEFTTDVQLEDVAVRDTAVSDAVDEPFRAMILDMLADEERTIAEIHRNSRVAGSTAPRPPSDITSTSSATPA